MAMYAVAIGLMASGFWAPGHTRVRRRRKPPDVGIDSSAEL